MDHFETVSLSIKELTCPICLQKYDLNDCQPIALACGHNLCSTCLKEIDTCPICRSMVRNKVFLKKNVLIASLITPKSKTKSCKKHNRPLEFFCKDHDELVCVECGFDGKHFSHEIIKFGEINSKAEETKTVLQKIEKKNVETKQKLDTFLEDKRKTLKRSIDEALNDYLEPLLELKKKLHKEADSFVFCQNGVYETEIQQAGIAKWKEENMELLDNWEKDPNGQSAKKLLNNQVSKMERKIKKFEKKADQIENEAEEKSKELLEEIRSRFEILKDPWKKIEKKINKIIKKITTITDPKFELEKFMLCLKECGIISTLIEETGEQILELQKPSQEFKVDNKNFDYTLEKLNIRYKEAQRSFHPMFYSLLEKVNSLKDIKLSLNGLNGNTLFDLAKTLTKIETITSISANLEMVEFADSFFMRFYFQLTQLPNLEKLQLSIKEQITELLYFLPDSVGPPKTLTELKEVDLCFTNFRKLTNQGLGEVLLNLKNSTQITSFKIAIIDCEHLDYESFEGLCKTLEVLTNLEELNIALEGFNDLDDLDSMTLLSNSLVASKNLKKFSISFARVINLSQRVLKSFFEKVFTSNSLQEITELSIDLTQCQAVSGLFINYLGNELEKLSQLTKLKLALKGTSTSQYSIIALVPKLAKLENLTSFSLDCRKTDITCQAQLPVLQNLSKLTKLTEKEFLFEEEKEESLPDERDEDEYENLNDNSQGNQDGSQTNHLLSGFGLGRGPLPRLGASYRPINIHYSWY